MKNRFEALGNIEDPQEEDDKLLESYRDAVKIVMGKTTRRREGQTRSAEGRNTRGSAKMG